MSGGESKIADTPGRFLQVVEDGRQMNDASWTSGRILLSNKRLVLAGSDGKRTIPLSEVDRIEGRFDANQAIAQESNYVSVRLGDDVLLLAATEPAAFEMSLYRALLNGEVILARHPAVEGGVVQDTEWTKARVQVSEEVVDIALASGELVEVELDDVGALEDGRRTVLDEERTVLEVEHSEDGTSIQSYLSGTERHTSFLRSLLRKGEQRSAAGFDLSADEEEVLMALYSGVSPFEIPEFVGMEVDEVEEIYDQFIELEIVDEIRVRREVGLTARGRNVASRAMNDE